MRRQMELKDKKVNYAWPVTSCNREDYNAFIQFMQKYPSLFSHNKIAIWGAGIRGTEFSIFFERNNFRNILFVDNNPEKWGGFVNDYPIISPIQLEEKMKLEQIRILISTENSNDIEKQLTEKGYCKGQEFFTVESGLYDKYMEEFERNYNGDVLFLGDCEFSKISILDRDMDNLAEMLRKRGGEKHIKVLAMHGMGIRSFYHVLCSQVSMGMRPKRLALMVNLDTLTGKQHLLPRSQHEELLQRIYQFSTTKNDEFEEYLQVVHQRNKNHKIEFFTRNPSGKVVSEQKAKNYFRLNYMYDLDIKTEGMAYLEKILDFARKENILVTAFTPPVNYTFARQLFGTKFQEKYIQNIEKIQSVVTEKQGTFLNLSFCLEPEFFAMPNTPDETANEQGRKQLTDLLFKAIQEEF